jgi:hypothetical protein
MNRYARVSPTRKYAMRSHADDISENLNATKFAAA